MFLWALSRWLDDKLHRREQTVNEEISLDRAISMLELSRFEDAKVTKYDFKDSSGLRNDYAAFLKEYFTPEDQDHQLTIEHSVSFHKSGNELHRLLFSYLVKGEEREKSSAYFSSFWRNPQPPRSYPVLRNLRNAEIKFYSKS